MSNSLQPHGLQHTRPPFPSPSPGVCRSLCSLHLWCCPDIWSSDCSLLLLPSIFPSISLHQIPLQGSLPCRFQGAWVTQWSYEPCYVGLPKTMGHNREFWQNVIHWRREWQTTPVCLPWEHHKLYICVYLKIKSNQFHSSNKIQKYLVNTYYPQNNFEYLNHSLLYHSLCNHSHIVGHLHCLQFYFLIHSGEVNIFVDKEFNTYI